MHLKQLTLEEVRSIYHAYLLSDFPPAEVKPMSRIEEMWNHGIYGAYGLYEKEELAGYALFVIPPEGNVILLDYFAICSDKRCGGYGSKFLKLLAENIKDRQGILLEVENPEFAIDEESKTLMERRIGFYERNGLNLTDVSSCLFTVEYRTMILLFNNDLELDHRKELNGIYHAMFPQEVYEKHVEIR